MVPAAMAVSVPFCHAVLPFPAAARAPLARSRGGRLGLASCCGAGPISANAVTCAAPVAGAARVGRRRCELFDLHRQVVPYVDSWGWQKSIVERRKALVGIDTDTDEDHSDTLIALQHPPVYTLGNGNDEKYLNFNLEDSPIEIHRIDRAGQVTYHGPGQLVLYPVLNLRHQKKDLVWYQRSIEGVIIRALQSAFSIKAARIDGLTGVWVGDQKVAAIGIMCARWIVYHGLALNVTTDLTPFEHIVPCGIKGRSVGSIKQILQKASSGRELNDAELMDIAYESLIKEFAEFFQLSLEPSPDLLL
ncbi:octanoyltransferase LIP2p2, chloroplastic-like [Hordeum vulgare subsp. vulgare]|uniref:lipoyl(octanoyl) transferase n=1 Tax=Hordeum vulgare subsp. vulgare TaxID=112509 RepID=A0A8I7BDS5_HORVV|nr:octanoyltransferase LIP2p2, chloroplastic-like [Hordeum vulgare subsp. vulgare]